MATITGDAYPEVIVGRAGESDTITGGPGDDLFVFSRIGASQTDVITDFGSIYFRGQINGAQETPANTQPGTGTVTASLNRAGDAMS